MQQATPGTGEAIGQVRCIQGAAVIQRAGAPEPQPANEGDPVFVGDMIVTDPGPEDEA